jgi:hypothetical protein
LRPDQYHSGTYGQNTPLQFVPLQAQIPYKISKIQQVAFLTVLTCSDAIFKASRPSKRSTFKFGRNASGSYTRFNASPTSNSRFRSKRKFQSIHKEILSPDRRRARSSSAYRDYRDFDVNEDTFKEDADEEAEEEGEDELFQWEEEETLVFALMNEK